MVAPCAATPLVDREAATPGCTRAADHRSLPVPPSPMSPRAAVPPQGRRPRMHTVPAPHRPPCKPRSTGPSVPGHFSWSPSGSWEGGCASAFELERAVATTVGVQTSPVFLPVSKSTASSGRPAAALLPQHPAAGISIRCVLKMKHNKMKHKHKHNIYRKEDCINTCGRLVLGASSSKYLEPIAHDADMISSWSARQHQSPAQVLLSLYTIVVSLLELHGISVKKEHDGTELVYEQEEFSHLQFRTLVYVAACRWAL